MSKKETPNIWMVRAGSGSVLIDDFLNEDIIAIGWNEIGKLSTELTYDSLKGKIHENYPDWNQGKLGQSTGQIWRFYKEFKIGDKVVTYDSNSREYYRGEIKGHYEFNENYAFHHYRRVKWYDEPIGRDHLSIESKNTLGSTLTIFQLSEAIWNEFKKNDPSVLTQVEIGEIEEMRERLQEMELEQLKKDAISRSFEFIKDIIYKLSWEESELLTAGILRAMGYKTRMSPKGGDGGYDIIASTDGLEMTEPIIKTEVKHKTKSKEKVGAPDIRNFIGGLRNSTKGIYVSTTGFSKDAKQEADRANFHITLIDLDRLVELITEYYEEMDIETKTLIPLKKIYWPV